jgi:hypothetical protein
MVMATNLAEDEINYGNFKYSESRSRIVIASGIEEDMMMVVVVVYEHCRVVRG